MIAKWKKRLNDTPIFNKLFLICLLICISISLLSGIIVYRYASSIILEKTIGQATETIQQLSENYNTFVMMICNKLDMLAFNPAVQDQLGSENEDDEDDGYYSGAQTLRRQIVILFNSVYMEDLEIYGENGSDYYFSVAGKVSSLENEEELKIIAMENKGKTVTVNDVENSGCIQIVKEINDLLSMETLGVLRNSIRVSALEEIQKGIDFSYSGEILLLDEDNGIILGNDLGILEKEDLSFGSTGGYFYYQIDGRKYVVIYQTAEDLGWKTVGIIPMQEINNSVTPLLSGIAVACLLGIALGFLLSGLISRIFVHPLLSTGDALEKFASGDFSVNLDETRKDEFGNVNRVFNNTIKQVENLLNEVADGRLLSKEMEMKALQAQINPHFLYNALDTVNWMARKRGEDDICEMVQAISGLLRVSISNKENVFTVEKELSYVDDYIYIQKKRFQNRFTVTEDIDEEIYDQLIPKLTIQPLVENAIVHSVEVCKKQVTLQIIGHKNGEDILIQVKDNGVGMDEMTISRIFSGTPGTEDTSGSRNAHTGLGINAVDKRLKYMYGETYGLSVESALGEGTCFTIRFPYRDTKEGE